MIPHARFLSHLSLAVIAASLIAGCSDKPSDKPKVETRVAGNDHFVTQAGNPSAIDLPAVEKAFWDTKAQDFTAWMGKFESRVNEIYDGGVVSLDARRNPQNLLSVTGYLEKNNQEGYQPNGDAKLFAIDQTDTARNNNMAYNVSGHDGSYYPRSHSLLDNPFIQMMVIGSLMQRPYSTPFGRTTYLRDHQTTYRQTPTYQTEKRTRVRAFGTNSSQRAFGTTPMPAGTKNSTQRSWSGSTPAATSGTAGASNAWGGRRTTGTGTTSGTAATSGTTATTPWGGRTSGSAGTPGTSGASGTTGSSSWGGRTSGSTGTPGTSGASGATGSSALSGRTSGSTGTPGTSGSSGTTGSSSWGGRTSGTAGTPGTSGSSGTTGSSSWGGRTSGSTGTSGTSGSTGSSSWGGRSSSSTGSSSGSSYGGRSSGSSSGSSSWSGRRSSSSSSSSSRRRR